MSLFGLIATLAGCGEKADGSGGPMNHPPSTPVVSLYPAQPTAAQVLTCTAMASDPDGDTVGLTVTWTRDTVAFTNTTSLTIPNDTIPPGVTQIGESWTCTVTASDGQFSSQGNVTAVISVPLPPNALVIVLDDVGQDKVGLFDEADVAPPTPTIDALAEAGMRFDNFYVSPSCSPTRATLMTGRHPRRTGIGEVIFIFTHTVELDEREFTLPLLLRHAPVPYTSGAFGKWHLTIDDNPEFLNHPLRLGFDWFQGTLDNLHVTVTPDSETPGYYHHEYLNNGVLTYSDTFAVTETVNDVSAWIQTTPEPWFAYVALHAAHTPLSPAPQDLVPSHTVPPEQIQPTDWYDPMVEAADTEIARLLASLAPDVRARTNVFLLADNGTPEDRVLPPYDPERSKLSLYDGGTRVPLVVQGPAVLQPGALSLGLVHAVDLMPTLAELAGISEEQIATLSSLPRDGASFVPILQNATTEIREIVYVERFEPNGDAKQATMDLRMARDSKYKLIESTDGTQLFFEYTGDPYSEGADLITLGEPLSLPGQAAFAKLHEFIEDQVAAMPYDWK